MSFIKFYLQKIRQELRWCKGVPQEVKAEWKKMEESIYKESIHLKEAKAEEQYMTKNGLNKQKLMKVISEKQKRALV